MGYSYDLSTGVKAAIAEMEAYTESITGVKPNTHKVVEEYIMHPDNITVRTTESLNPNGTVSVNANTTWSAVKPSVFICNHPQVLTDMYLGVPEMKQYTLLITEYCSGGTIKNRAFVGILPDKEGDYLMSLNGTLVDLFTNTEAFNTVYDYIYSQQLTPTESIDVFPGANLAVIGTVGMLEDQ